MMGPRRQFLKNIALTGAAVATSGVVSANTAKSQNYQPVKLKANINHSVSRWTYGHLSIEQLCEVVKAIGFSAIDLVGPKDWPTLKKYNIDSSMCNGAELNLVDGWIHPQFHDSLAERYLSHIELVAEAGYKNLVCFSGNARGLTEERIIWRITLHGASSYVSN
jgi:hydroxypyruvate isomerase